MGSNIQLAIVIPAYKPEFLVEALTSLCVQTDKRFKVYLGDDASPGSLEKICSQFQGELDLSYHRFPENLGKTSLVDQWHRCIELSSEPWIWLFSDDDIMEAGCVESFYAALAETKSKYDLYRFNTLRINEKGKLTEVSPPHPLVESGLEFAYHRLCRNRMSFASEYVFSRKIFLERGGMVKFPLAWCSDDASWISFAGESGIFTIYGPRVLWRLSQLNTSYTTTARSKEKIEACILFWGWLKNRYDADTINREMGIDFKHFVECFEGWLRNQLAIQAPLGLATWVRISKDPRFFLLGSFTRRFTFMALADFLFYKERLLKYCRG